MRRRCRTRISHQGHLLVLIRYTSPVNIQTMAYTNIKDSSRQLLQTEIYAAHPPSNPAHQRKPPNYAPPTQWTPVLVRVTQLAGWIALPPCDRVKLRRVNLEWFSPSSFNPVSWLFSPLTKILLGESGHFSCYFHHVCAGLGQPYIS